MTKEAMLRLALDRPLESSPGEFNYSNLGYLLLGLVIDVASGTPYEMYVRRRALRPLGLAGVSLDPDLAHLSSFGGWRFSAAEYLRFQRVFAPGNAELFTPAARAALDAEPYYSFGRFMNGAKAWQHTGSWGIRVAAGRSGSGTGWLVAVRADRLGAVERTAARDALVRRVREIIDAGSIVPKGDPPLPAFCTPQQ